MPEIDHVVATVTYPSPHEQRLEEIVHPAPVTFVAPGDIATFERAQDSADVAILQGDAGAALARAPRLRWVHCDHAGLDGSAVDELLRQGIALTSSAGRSAPALAEHALLFMLLLAYQYPRFLRAQRRRVWGTPDQAQLRALHGRTVAIVGTGHTGSALAHRCHALGMRVLGYRRRSMPADAPFDQLRSAGGGDRLEEVIGDADFVVLAASLNDQSHHMVGSSQLGAMKRGSYLVNVARGGLVDEDALVEALRRGHLAGAATDVAETEPLPPSSPLWKAPNFLITPHVTPRVEDRTERSLEIIAENVRRYRAGEPLLNQLGPEDAFSGASSRSRGRSRRSFARAWRRLAGRRP